MYERDTGTASSTRPLARNRQRAAEPAAGLLRLHASAGNGAVSGLLAVQRTRQPLLPVQRLLSSDAVAHPGPQQIRRGLIRGSYTAVDNVADLHVDAKGDGGGLDPADMLAVAIDVEQAMRARHAAGGPLGKLELHPTGAAIVKMVVELLGEALGGWFGKHQARALKLWRKQTAVRGGARPADRLTADVLPEHFASLRSLRGARPEVSIVPRIMSANAAYKATDEATFRQDMMVTTAAGDRRFAAYEAHASDANEDIGASLDLTVTADKLPAVIAVLRTL